MYQTPLEMVQGLSLVGFGIGGLLVGFGTKLGNGCTSGHGLCGLPRFSKRSWLSVPIFFGVALLTANFLNASVVKLDFTQPVYVTKDFDVVTCGIVCCVISFIFLIISGIFYYRSAIKFFELNIEGFFYFSIL